MSVKHYVDDLEAIAQRAVIEAEAVKPCPFHPEVLIVQGNPDAERHAYAIATNLGKREGFVATSSEDKEEFAELRTDVMEAVKHELDNADDECGACANRGRD